MSVESLALVLNHSKAPTPLARLVLIGIANHDGDGGAWPTLATLMRYTGASKSTVRRAIAALEECGEIKVHVQEGGTRWTRADRRPNRYEILVTCPAECDRSANHRINHGVSTLTPRLTTNGGSDSADGVSTVTPEPSLEPSLLEPSPRTAFSERVCSKPRTALDEEADDLAKRFWRAYRERHGVDHPQERGQVGLRAVFKSALKRGLTSREIRDAVRDMDGTLNLNRVVQERNRQAGSANERWAVSDERWVIPQ